MPHPRNSLKYSEPMTSNQQTGSRAYLFSIVLVAIIGGLLFGYDTAVVSGAEQALVQFFRSAADFTYTSWMHGFTASSALIGCVIGGAISGLLASRFGRKRSLVMAAVLFFISAVGSWRPESGILPYGEASLPLLVSFNIYRIIGGIGVGLASAVCPMYIAEISPAKIRGTLVSCNQFAIIFGMLVVYFVNYLIRNHLGDTGEAIQAAMIQIGWRRMFLSEAFPAGAFFLLIMLVPETPRFLALRGCDAKAFAVCFDILLIYGLLGMRALAGRHFLINIKNNPADSCIFLLCIRDSIFEIRFFG